MTRENNKKNPRNQHTDGVFAQLSDKQWRFVTAMVENPSFSKKDAATYIGLVPDTAYRWPSYVNEAVEQARRNVHDAALAMRKQAVLKAVGVKLALLNSDDEAIRSKAASEIIEWELGKAATRADIDITSDGERLTGLIINLDDDDGD